MTDLLAPATADYRPTAADFASYDTWLDTTNLPARLRAHKEHMLPSDWLNLMSELGSLSSAELREAAAQVKRPHLPLGPMWEGDDCSPPKW